MSPPSRQLEARPSATGFPCLRFTVGEGEGTSTRWLASSSSSHLLDRAASTPPREGQAACRASRRPFKAGLLLARERKLRDEIWQTFGKWRDQRFLVMRKYSES